MLKPNSSKQTPCHHLPACPYPSQTPFHPHSPDLHTTTLNIQSLTSQTPPTNTSKQNEVPPIIPLPPPNNNLTLHNAPPLQPPAKDRPSDRHPGPGSAHLDLAHHTGKTTLFKSSLICTHSKLLLVLILLIPVNHISHRAIIIEGNVSPQC